MGDILGRLGGALIGRLGGALIEALGAQLDRKVNETTERIQNELKVAAQTPNISGQWHSQDGAVVTFSQTGSQVSVEGFGRGVALWGQGQIRGKSIQVQGFSPAGGPFRANLVVSQDGNLITGHLIDGYARTMPVHLQR